MSRISLKGTRQTLYESRARSDGNWSDKQGWSALFEAAWRDFPFSAVSPRRVTVDLPLQQSLAGGGRVPRTVRPAPQSAG